MACGQTQGSPSSSKRQLPLSLLQHWRVSFRTLRACPGVSRGSIFAGYFVFVTSLFISFLLCDELGVCRVIQCNDRRFAKPLFPADLPKPCFFRIIKPLYSSSRKIRVAHWRLRCNFFCACSSVKYKRIVPSGSMYPFCRETLALSSRSAYNTLASLLMSRSCSSCNKNRGSGM